MPAKRIPGNSRDYLRILGDRAGRYENVTTGIIVSRRQVENLHARELGFDSIYQYQELSRAVGGLGGIDSEQTNFILYLIDVYDVSIDGALHDKEFLKYIANYVAKPDSVLPGGPLAQLLEFVGLREPDASYNVGDTPKHGQRYS